jgi:hypothetical protein
VGVCDVAMPPTMVAMEFRTFPLRTRLYAPAVKFPLLMPYKNAAEQGSCSAA